MHRKRRDFTGSLALGIAIATLLFQLTGIFLYHAFAQYTRPQLLLNLPPTSMTTFVRALYAVGVVAGYLLQIAPLFNLFDKSLMKKSGEE